MTLPVWMIGVVRSRGTRQSKGLKVERLMYLPLHGDKTKDQCIQVKGVKLLGIVGIRWTLDYTANMTHKLNRLLMV